MKFVVTKRGTVERLHLPKDSFVTFKTFDEHHDSICSYGFKSIDWVKKHYGSNKVAVCYCENKKYTVIAHIKSGGRLNESRLQSRRNY